MRKTPRPVCERFGVGFQSPTAATMPRRRGKAVPLRLRVRTTTWNGNREDFAGGRTVAAE